MGSRKRTYNAEFREGAVRTVAETGKPIPEVTEELGVHPGTLQLLQRQAVTQRVRVQARSTTNVTTRPPSSRDWSHRSSPRFEGIDNLRSGLRGHLTTVDQPPRGTRPANRRELILAAASELFAEHGYEHVGVVDVAEAVRVGPSALYRHFKGKQDLLTEVLLAELGSVAEIVVSGMGSARDRLRSLAMVAYDYRRSATLLQREARHLPSSRRAEVREAARDVEDAMRSVVSEARPDLSSTQVGFLAAGLMAVLTSPAFTHQSLPRGTWDALLVDSSMRVIDAPLPDWEPASRRDAEPGLEPRSRREALLSAALRLFATRTYASVGIEDVAAAVGMAGPSVYGYFTSKQEILATTLDRGSAVLAMDVASTLASSSTPVEALPLLIDRYIHFALANHHLVDVLITELRNLEEPARTVAVSAQHEYVMEWTHLLTQVHHGVVPSQSARAQVHMALMLINAVARSDRLRSSPDTHEAVRILAGRVLNV